MEDIDYAAKINTFKLMVETNNDEIALKYLEKAEWDESLAATLYLTENTTRLNQNQNISQNKNYNPSSNSNPNINRSQNINQNNKIRQLPNTNSNNNSINIVNNHHPNSNSNNNQQSSSGQINILCEIPMNDVLPKPSTGILSGLSHFFKPKSNYHQIFSCFKNYTKTYSNFIMYLKTKIGLLFLYDEKNIEALKVLFKNILSDSLTKELINDNNKILLPILTETDEGLYFVAKFSLKRFPWIFVCQMKPNKKAYAILKAIPVSHDIQKLRQHLLECTYYKPEDYTYNPSPQEMISQQSYLDQQLIYDSIQEENMNNHNNHNIQNNQNNQQPHNNINRSNNDHNGYASEYQKKLYDQQKLIFSRYEQQNKDRILIQQQKNELAELERKEKQKILDEQKEKEEQMKLEEQKKLKEKLYELKRKNLPKEPDDSNPDISIIKFRYPDGETLKERKFLKTDKIQLLYDFVESLGREIYTEDDLTDFELMQPFPFKRFTDKNKTLEEEGLVHNSVIQIKEI